MLAEEKRQQYEKELRLKQELAEQMAEEQHRIKQKEAELAQRELSLLERELTMHMMYNNQLNQTPTPKKRKGKFR